MEPERRIPLGQSLGETLRRHHAASLRQAAEIICDHSAGEERAAEARRLVSLVMIEAALNRLTGEVRSELLAVLAPVAPMSSRMPIGSVPPHLIFIDVVLIADQIKDHYAVVLMSNPLSVPATKHDLILLEKRMEQVMDKRLASAHRDLLDQIKHYFAVLADNIGRPNHKA